MAVWQPIASMVTVAPSRSSRRSSAGMAVISFDFSATATCPSTSRLALAQALTRCRAARPASPARAPRSALPSMGTTCPAVPGATACTQARKQAWKASGSSAAKTRPKVSWQGIPPGSGRKVRSQGSFASANVTIPTKPSAPHSVAHRAIVRISSSRCCLVRSTRGSGRAAKCAVTLVGVPVMLYCLLAPADTGPQYRRCPHPPGCLPRCPLSEN
jgi:hypothetical protein